MYHHNPCRKSHQPKVPIRCTNEIAQIFSKVFLQMHHAAENQTTAGHPKDAHHSRAPPSRTPGSRIRADKPLAATWRPAPSIPDTLCRPLAAPLCPPLPPLRRPWLRSTPGACKPSVTPSRLTGRASPTPQSPPPGPATSGGIGVPGLCWEVGEPLHSPPPS